MAKTRVLVVHNPFGGHEKGARITDADEIAKILAGEHAHHVVQSDHELTGDESNVAPNADTPESK